MNEVRFNNNLLYIENIEISFRSKIMQIKHEGDKIFVLLNIPPKKELSYDDCHNIYCYSNMGKMLWQIGERPKGDDTVFTMINIIESELYANDFLGRRFSVNKDNGSIEKMNITK
ncbi:hypothetical protein [Lacrimispora sp.]|uniref:hypothetical protein n=1 Tax=Lacrimispora sp. TaxID=2719234 RepID=UPI0028A2259D|nr:hypothetical protein [Lacrimispora sp.]